jgi:hypothetical protein
MNHDYENDMISQRNNNNKRLITKKKKNFKFFSKSERKNIKTKVEKKKK